MKKILAILMALTLVLSMFVVASAEDEKPLIGIIAPETSHGWVGGVTYYAQAKADELELNYNRARQTAITNQLIEIVSGSEAQK